MNLAQAEAISNLYTELMNSIDKTKLKIPEPTFRKEHPYTIDQMYLEDGLIYIKWQRYEGCGSYDRETTCQSIDELFGDQA